MAAAQRPRLPVLFLSCREERQADPGRAPLMARLLASGATPEAVLFITIAEQDDRLQLIGSGTHGERLSALAEGLANRGVCALVRRCASSPVGDIAAELFGNFTGEFIELRLAANCEEPGYSGIGQALSDWRERGTLLVCLDRVDGGQRLKSLYDSYWLDLMSSWIEQHQWRQVVTGLNADAISERPAIGTFCLLQAALGSAGMRLPERLLGYELDDAGRALSGFCWMT